MADALGMSLSEFFVTALTACVATCQSGDVTKRLDEVYAKEQSALDPGLSAIQIASIEERRVGA